MPGGGSKPGERRGGRKKGTPNRFTADLRAMILGALQAAGGQEYFQRIARSHPAAFMRLLGKLLPMTVAGDPKAPMEGKVEVVLVKSYAEANPPMRSGDH